MIFGCHTRIGADSFARDTSRRTELRSARAELRGPTDRADAFLKGNYEVIHLASVYMSHIHMHEDMDLHSGAKLAKHRPAGPLFA